jgi:hypothetical protein
MLSDKEIQQAVGLVDPEHAAFIKQYGERRSGTNATRALIMSNFHVFVLMHLLGDKHAAPVDFGQVWETVAQDADADWQFVVRTTYAATADTSRWGEYPQLRFIKGLCGPISDALRNGRLYYAISIREPYSWADAYLRHLAWPQRSLLTAWEEALAGEVLAAACRLFNDRYRAWLTLHVRSGSRSIIVHHERLRQEWAALLSEIEQGMHLTRSAERFVPVTRAVEPTHWDYVRSRANDDWFQRPSPTPAAALTQGLHEIVTREIDWTLMRSFGYRERPFETESGRGAAS